MIQIDMQMPEKCEDCIFCDDNCSCVASEYDGFGINVGCAYRTERRDIRCPLKEQPQIVRCKDCKHYENGGWFTQCFRHNGISPDSNWFCADGVRRTE